MKTPRENHRKVFFALWPDAAGRAALAAWQPALRRLCGGREMQTENLHATLVFLGDVAEYRLEAMQLAAQEVQGRGFELRLTAARYWGHNHIVYAAPDAVPQPLFELVNELEQRLRKHRFHFEQQAYKPHVTLLRHARWDDTGLPFMSPVRWQFDDFALVQSLSDEQGARYEVLARFPLRRAV